MTNFDVLRDSLDIVGLNRYNPNNINLLEKCVASMISENNYDKDIMMTLLKLYQLNPDTYNERYVSWILLKTMMAFPRNDYALAKCLIDSNRIDSQELRRVFYIGELLESCNFASFWRVIYDESAKDKDDEVLKKEEMRKLIEPIKGFKDSIRNYACQVIHVTFQKISKEQLKTLLGGPSINDAILISFARLHNWHAAGEFYLVQNHEDKIKSRNIEEKLKFDQCLRIIS